jgi:hypothetical protein
MHQLDAEAGIPHFEKKKVQLRVVGLCQCECSSGTTPSGRLLPIRHQPKHKQKLLGQPNDGEDGGTRYLQAATCLTSCVEKAI